MPKSKKELKPYLESIDYHGDLLSKGSLLLLIFLTTTITLLGTAFAQPNAKNLKPKDDSIVWHTSKDDVIALAKSEGKKILLIAGREACGNTRYMRNTVCEKTSPEIKQLIQTHFIPWYSDVDSNYEYSAYAQGLVRFTLPLICIIDPLESDKYLDRTTATQTPEDFFERLKKYSNSIQLSGDLNNNDVYDLQDLIISLQIFTKTQIPFKPYVSADINENNKIALPESIFVLQKLSLIKE